MLGYSPRGSVPGYLNPVNLNSRQRVLADAQRKAHPERFTGANDIPGGREQAPPPRVTQSPVSQSSSRLSISKSESKSTGRTGSRSGGRKRFSTR